LKEKTHDFTKLSEKTKKKKRSHRNQQAYDAMMMMMMQRPCLPLLFRSGKELAETAKQKP
jgi:hypothetical protein